MNDHPCFSRQDFDSLVEAQRRLVGLMNDLEYHLYQLGDVPADERVTGCQQSAGELLTTLRNLLFRYDQQVLPWIESHLADGEDSLSPGE